MEKHSKKKLKIKAEAFILIDNVLFLKDEDGLHKKVICNDQEEIMFLEATKLHSDNHFGMVRFEAKCNDYFFKINRDIIRKVVRQCTVCIQSQPLKVKERQIHIVASRPLERLQIDLIDMKQYKDSNGQYAWILTVLDVYSKFAWAFPLVTKRAAEVVEKLEDLFYMIGPPQILQCDNGKEFVNKEMTTLCEGFKIKIVHSRPRHPQSQGQVERFNQTLTRFLQKFVFEEENADGAEDKKWKKHLKKIVYDYNLAKHSATNTTPFKLLYQYSGLTLCTVLKNLVKMKKFLESLQSLIHILKEWIRILVFICPNTTLQRETLY